MAFKANEDITFGGQSYKKGDFITGPLDLGSQVALESDGRISAVDDAKLPAAPVKKARKPRAVKPKAARKSARAKK